jgi:hypothetical protein
MHQGNNRFLPENTWRNDKKNQNPFGGYPSRVAYENREYNTGHLSSIALAGHEQLSILPDCFT